jgi:soluble epoxide hydrolase / lipid-phosphate phosphatase
MLLLYPGSRQSCVALAIPKERYNITHPVLLVTTLRDTICLPTVAKAITSTTCTNAVVRELDTGHWAMFEKPHELNASIDEFLGSLSAEM